MRFFALSILFIIMSLNIGCAPSKEEINKRLIKGCEAAVQYVLEKQDSDYSYVDLIKPTFERDKQDKTIRKITLLSNVLYREFSEEEQTYVCTFTEAKNLFNYRADINYAEVEEKKYGRVDGTLKNMGIAEFSTFNESVRQVMR